MIVAKLISGLGNQLFQYALGRRISLLRNTPLKLDLSFYDTQTLRGFKLSHYAVDIEIATQAEIQAVTYTDHGVTSKIYRKLQRFIPHHKRATFKERQWWVYEPNIWKIPSTVYMDGYWQHYKYFESFQEQMRQDLTLKMEYTSIIGTLAYQIGSNNSSVSLHIRRGDYITDKNANKLMGVLPLEYYRKAVAEVVKSVVNPIFYVFSDDLGWVEACLQLPYPMVFVDIDNGKYDFLELELMSRCKHNIIANSSFSWWGAYLNSNPNKVVVAPAQWCVPSDVNQRIKLQHPSWIKL